MLFKKRRKLVIKLILFLSKSSAGAN